MDKILVEIFLPAENKKYDVYIPFTSKLYEILDLLKNTITELSEGYFTASEDAVLCDRKTGTIFNINMSPEELGLINGSKLILI